MLAFSIFSTIILVTIAGALGKDGSSTVSLDKTKFVEYFVNNSNFDRMCERNYTKGIHNPVNPGSVAGQYKCCNGKRLVGPFSVQLTGWDRTKVQYPPFTQCDYNVTIDNGNDDFGTLMWKIYACKVKSILADKDLDFKAYVELMTRNYPMEHNLRKIIRDGNKECPGGDKETVFLKKLQNYYWCFLKAEQKICDVPVSSEAKGVLSQRLNETKILNDKTNVTCPLVPEGTSRNDHCCHGVSTPSSWVHRSLEMMYVGTPYSTLPNGTTVIEKSFTDCTTTGAKLVNDTEYGFEFECYKACALNPVSFSVDGFSKPEIKWELSTAIMDKYLSWFNTKAKNAIRKTVMKAKKGVKILIERKPSGIKFEDADEAFKKLKSPRDKAMLYCGYYRTIDRIITSSSSVLCNA